MNEEHNGHPTLDPLGEYIKKIYLEPYFVSYELFLGYKFNVSLVDKINKVGLGLIMSNFEHPKTILLPSSMDNINSWQIPWTLLMY